MRILIDVIIDPSALRLYTKPVFFPVTIFGFAHDTSWKSAREFAKSARDKKPPNFAREN